MSKTDLASVPKLDLTFGAAARVIMDLWDQDHEEWIRWVVAPTVQMVGRGTDVALLDIHHPTDTDEEHDALLLFRVEIALPQVDMLLGDTVVLTTVLVRGQSFPVPTPEYWAKELRRTTACKMCTKKHAHAVLDHYSAPHNAALEPLLVGRQLRITIGPQ